MSSQDGQESIQNCVLVNPALVEDEGRPSQISAAQVKIGRKKAPSRCSNADHLDIMLDYAVCRELVFTYFSSILLL